MSTTSTHVPAEHTRDNRAARRRDARLARRVRAPQVIHFWVTLPGGRATTLCGDERQWHSCRAEDGTWLHVDFRASAHCPGCGLPLCPTCRSAAPADG